MKEHFDLLKKVKLFSGISENDLLSALGCLNANIKTFAKDDILFCEGEEANRIGIILLGEAQTQKTDFEGNINIISKLYPPAMVGGAAAFSLAKRLPFDVVAVCDTQMLFINSESLIHPCKNHCTFHNKIIENMLSVLAEKNMEFSQKIDILTKRTIREKLLSYLYSQSKRTSCKTFSVSLSRRQMAEYLSINRSALSRELCKMRDEGILDFDGNHFSFR